eukprot:scaffold364807_cov18-Prasinocladus_malaysianus.AAC.1
MDHGCDDVWPKASQGLFCLPVDSICKSRTPSPTSKATSGLVGNECFAACQGPSSSAADQIVCGHDPMLSAVSQLSACGGAQPVCAGGPAGQDPALGHCGMESGGPSDHHVDDDQF